MLIDMKWVAKRNTIAAALLAIAIAVVILFAAWLRIPDPLPAAIRSSTPISLFYPTSLPEGYVLNRDSFSINNGVVSYTVQDSKGNKLLFTQQAPPASFNFEDFATKQISAGRRGNSPHGELVIGTFQGNAVASLRSSNTWLLISSPDKASLGNLEKIASELKVYNPPK